MIYDLIAPIYDEVNKDIDYSAWADFIEECIKKHYEGKPELILDLGCGSGKMTVELSKRGYDMTGIDYSPDMLDKARSYAEKNKLDNKILWLLQDMREFELYGTVDVIVSCLDCINHLTTKSDLQKCFNLSHNYLVRGGLFIFDINGRTKFENIYGESCYAIETENSYCIWQNEYNKKSKICDFYITVFNENEDGKYTRNDEVQRERMYTIRSIKSSLESCGFEFLGAYSNFNFDEANDNDERIYIISKCIKG